METRRAEGYTESKKMRRNIMQEKFLAIDIGASSGRHIVGWMDGGRIHTEEVYRFPN